MCYIFIQLSKFQMLRPPSSQQPHRPTPTPPPPPPTVSRLSADAPVFSPCFEVETATCSRRRIKGRENMGKQEFKTIEGTHITSHIFIYFYIHILYIECIVHAVQSDKWWNPALKAVTDGKMQWSLASGSLLARILHSTLTHVTGQQCARRSIPTPLLKFVVLNLTCSQQSHKATWTLRSSFVWIYLQ